MIEIVSIIIKKGWCTILFPQFSPTYYDEQHRDVLGRMEVSYSESITLNQSYWNEANIDTRFEAGDQNLYNQMYGNLNFGSRRQFNFNRIRPVINMISGQQRKSRKSIIAVPIENADNKTADQFTKVIMWAVKQESMLETISDSFHGALVTGMNLLQVWMDYRSDPVSGNIKVDNCDYNSFIIDPYFRKKDLSDCNFIWKRNYLTKRECISLMPDKADEIVGLMGNTTGNGRDGKFQFLPEASSYGMTNLLTYDEFYYRDYRTQKMLCDRQTGEVLEWKNDDKETLDMFLEQNPTVTLIEQEIPTVRLSIVVQGRVLYDGPNPMGIDCYPFVGVFAYYNPQMPEFCYRVQGVVRSLRDPQFLFNRRRLIEMDILESQINSGWKFKEGSLINPADIYLTGQGRGLALKYDASMDDVQQIQPPRIDPSAFVVSENLSKDFSLLSGVNEELMGSAVDDKAGVLSMLRQGAGMTTLQSLFDNLDRSQKQLGKIMIDLIQANFTPGKIKKILGGEEPSPQFYNKAFGKYHADVEDGLNTETQRQMQFAQMIELKQLGLPISPEDLLQAATLQNKDRIIENLKKAEESQQKMQQQQALMAMELQAAQIELARSRSKADIGLAVERASRVEENRAMAIEKLHEANAHDRKAVLDQVKTIEELEAIKISHIEKYLNMANALKASQQPAINNLEI